MNLSLLKQPKRIKKGTNTLYIYAPSVATTSDKLEPGTALRILDVFEGPSAAETTLKTMAADDWQNHKYGRLGKACTKGFSREDPCDCEKELSEMGAALKERVHYVLLTDVGK